MRHRSALRPIHAVAVVVCAGVLWGCGGGALSKEAPKLQEININPANPRIPKGSKLKLEATGMFSDGIARPLGGPASWQTNDGAIAAVDAQGNVTGMSEGGANISASYRGITGTTSVSVGAPALQSITIAPNPTALPQGQSAQLRATGNFSDGTTQDLTQSATWSTSGPAIVSVSSAGIAIANAIGTATISATSGSVTGSARLTVRTAVAVALTVAPAASTLSLGNSLQLQALATLSNGTSEDVTASATWSSSQPSIATVNVQGNVAGVGTGSATLAASYQGTTASAVVSVGPAALVAITITPNPSSFPIGESEQLVATGKFSDGSSQNLTQSVTWSSSGSEVAVNPSGSVVAKAVGTVTISASSGSILGTATLTVNSAAVTAVSVVPATLAISLGLSDPLQAIAAMSDGTTQDVTAKANWVSNPSSVVTVAQGNVTAAAKGVAQVTATYQSMAGSASITVGPPVLVSIGVSPAQSSLPAGESEQLTATGKYSDGSIQNLTQSVTWTSSGSEIATLSVSPAGTVTAKAVGIAVISAVSGAITGSAGLTVSSPVVTGLSIVPSPVTVVFAGSRQLHAMATMSDGTSQDMTATATWTSMQPNIANISNGGMAAAGLQVGSTTIQAQVSTSTGSSFTASAQLTVMPLMLVSYISYLNASNSGIDGAIQLVNPGVILGNTCAMVYVFDQRQELNECCGCTISDNGIRTLSVLNDLTANTLTGDKPRAGEVIVVPSDATQNPQCNPASLSPTGVLSGWQTNAQGLPDSPQVTETPSTTVILNSNEASFLSNMCGYLQKLGSGKGICSCGTGD
jgi:uncharacterized protein YjdB